MSKLPAQKRVLFARVAPELHRQVKAAALENDLTLDEFVRQAIVAFIGKPAVLGEGPLAGLPASDRKRAERFIRFLRAAPPFLLDASDAAQAQLEAILREWKRSGKW